MELTGEPAGMLAGKKVLVLGLGISGLSAADFCARRGAHVVAADERPGEQLPGLSQIDPSVEVRTGCAFPDPAEFDLIVPSPGVPSERFAAPGRRIWGDIELAGRALRIPIVAVTGTNGKSTTVMLVEAMLRAAGLRTRAAGNVGSPALSLVGEALDVAVLEVSSFQIETTEAFRPRVAVILNVTPDHLDRHASFEVYADLKRRLLRQQRGHDVAVLNFDDAVVRTFAESAPAEVLPFSLRGPVGEGSTRRAAWLDSGAVVLRDGARMTRHPLDGLRLAGRHNLENVIAALAASWSAGAEPSRALVALAEFEGLPHRCQIVAEQGDVLWIDDSKATNVGAAARALEGMERPIVWIAGGRDKGLDFAPLAGVASRRVHTALLIGEAAPLLERALTGHVMCERVETLERAVRRAAECAHAGDVVLLAPACASFDQFKSYAERGDRFRAAVEALITTGGESR